MEKAYQDGQLAQAIEILKAQGITPQQYKHLPPVGIIRLAGLKP